MSHRSVFTSVRSVVALVLAMCLLAALVAVGNPQPAQPPAEPRPVGQGKLENSETPGAFTFVVIGGTTHESPEPMPAYVEAVKLVNRIAPDFSINVGDNVEGSRAVPKEWDAFEKTSADLAKPCFLIAGNHDTQKFGAEWARRFGPFYHDFVHKGIHFVLLCSDEPGKLGLLDEAQLAWLQQRLESTPAKARFVFCHEDFWRGGKMHADWFNKIIPMFKKHNVLAVFGGHHAVYDMQVIEGIRHFITQGGGMHGTTGKGKTPPQRGGFQHVLKVAVAEDGSAVITLTDLEGKEHPDTIGQTTPKAPRTAAPASAPASQPATN